MRSRAVHAHRGADARARYHIANLTNDMIRKKLDHIVFHDGITGTVKRHQNADADQQLRAAEDAKKRIYGNLRRITGHEYTARKRRRRIAVDEPAVHRNRRHIDTNAGKNSPKSRVIRTRHQIADKNIALNELHNDAKQNEITAKRMNQQISNTRTPTRRSRIVPDQESRCDSLQLPKEQEGNPVVS